MQMNEWHAPGLKGSEEEEVNISSRPWGRLQQKGGLELTPATVQTGFWYSEEGRACSLFKEVEVMSMVNSENYSSTAN